MSGSGVTEASIGQVLDSLTDKRWNCDGPLEIELLCWPPDVFAMVGTVLSESGAYIMAVESFSWPPKGLSRDKWAEHIREQARGEESGVDNLLCWRTSSVSNAPLPRVRDLWRIIKSHAKTKIRAVVRTRALWQALLELCALADEASSGAGVPPTKSRDEDALEERDEFQILCHTLLDTCLENNRPASLCKGIDPYRAVVLPKLHTPSNGITFRSMTHNLALVRGAAVQARWLENSDTDLSSEKRRFGEHLNLLVIPWPLQIDQRQFRPVMIERVRKLAPSCRFFTYVPRKTDKGFAKRIAKMVVQASSEVGKVDGIIFPELALNPTQYKLVRDQVMEHVGLLVSGISEAPKLRGHGENYVNVCTVVSGVDRIATESRQDKHHRWFLEDRQIQRYGLGAVLDPGKIWWESTSVKPREISFIAAESWLTFTVLICEDLARPDPVGDLVRAVGPNLVIALLLDGPQIKGRWAERSATVLADDPGCSVLSITSLGMTELSRQVSSEKSTRSIAMWKDPTGMREIELPPGAEAIVLSISNTYKEEWTADGRGDGGTTGSLRLVGVRPVFPKNPLVLNEGQQLSTR